MGAPRECCNSCRYLEGRYCGLYSFPPFNSLDPDEEVCLYIFYKNSNRIEDLRGEKAWQLGRRFAEAHKLEHISSAEEMYQEAMLAGCPSNYFDIFKYGAQSIWRERGELEDGD